MRLGQSLHPGGGSTLPVPERLRQPRLHRSKPGVTQSSSHRPRSRPARSVRRVAPASDAVTVTHSHSHSFAHLISSAPIVTPVVRARVDDVSSERATSSRQTATRRDVHAERRVGVKRRPTIDRSRAVSTDGDERARIHSLIRSRACRDGSDRGRGRIRDETVRCARRDGRGRREKKRA